MTRPRTGVWAELVPLTLILACLAGSLGLIVVVHKRVASRPKPRAAVALALPPSPSPVVEAKPAPAPVVEPVAPEPEPEPEPPPPPPEDPTPKELAKLTAAEAEQLLEASKADRKATSLEEARKAAEIESERWRRRQSLLDAQLSSLESKARKMETEADELALERDALLEERDARKAAIAKASTRPSGQAILPHKGPNGTWRRPIVVECTNGMAILQPQGISFGLLDLASGFGPSSNPFLAAIAREAVRIRMKESPDGAPVVPYIFFLVRPDGVRPYYEARGRLEPLGITFGYELADQDWVVEVSDLDDNAAWDGSGKPQPGDLPIRRPGVSPAEDEEWPTAVSPRNGGSRRPGLDDSDFTWPGQKALARSSTGGRAPSGPSPGGNLAGGPSSGPGDLPIGSNDPIGGGMGSVGSASPPGDLPISKPGRDGFTQPGRLASSGGGQAPGIEGSGFLAGNPGSPDIAGADSNPPEGGMGRTQPPGMAPRGLESGDEPGPSGTGPGERGPNRAGKPEADPGSDFVWPKSPSNLSEGRPLPAESTGSASNDAPPPSIHRGPFTRPLGMGVQVTQPKGGSAPGGSGESSDRPGSSDGGSSVRRMIGQGSGSPMGGTPPQGMGGVGVAMPPIGAQPAGSPPPPGSERAAPAMPDPGAGRIVDRRYEIVLVCTPRGVIIQPGGYRVTSAALKDRDGLLKQQLVALVKARRAADSSVILEPKVRFLVQPGGNSTYWAARSQVLLSGLDWPMTTQVSEPDHLSILPSEGW